MNKKGGVVTFLAIMIASLFIVSFSALLANTMWTTANNEFQNKTNETVPQNIKDDINDITFIQDLTDKIFIITFVLFLIGYIFVSAMTPTENNLFFLVSIFLLIILTILSMILSNAWKYLTENPVLSDAALQLSFTNFFMRYFPIITFLVGIIGLIIYYSRSKGSDSIGSSSNSGGGDSFDFE